MQKRIWEPVGVGRANLANRPRLYGESADDRRGGDDEEDDDRPRRRPMRDDDAGDWNK